MIIIFSSLSPSPGIWVLSEDRMVDLVDQGSKLRPKFNLCGVRVRDYIS